MFWHTEIDDVFDMILMIAFHTERKTSVSLRQIEKRDTETNRQIGTTNTQFLVTHKAQIERKQMRQIPMARQSIEYAPLQSFV